jgi:hypothetical protein
MDIRKTVTVVEDTLIDGGKPVAQPMRRVAVIAVVRNPLVDRNDENLNELIHDGEDLGRVLARRAVEHIDRASIAMLGKGAIIGTGGEPEHGQAILFPKFETAVRESLNLSSARMVGEKRILPPGSPIDIALQPADAVASGPTGKMEIRVPGSPRADEILVALVVAGPTGPG